MRGRGWMLGMAGTAALAIAFAGYWYFSGGKGQPTPAGTAHEDQSTRVLAARIGAGDAESLSAFRDKVAPLGDQGQFTAIDQTELIDDVELLQAAARGMRKYGQTGRAMIAGLAGTVLERMAIEPAPANWTHALGPIHDVIDMALADPEVPVRVAALSVTARIWNWAPGRTPLPVEESSLGQWKDAFCGPVTNLLIDDDPQVRAAAVLNLAQVPIDELAAPAVLRVADISADVRRQALIALAKRTEILTEEMILPCLYDEDPGIAMLAKVMLDQRGLTESQIDLGRQVYSPNASVRKAVIAQLQGRDDIDPVVWLIHLTRDQDERVRTEALNALRGNATDPKVRERLIEMAMSDPSGSIRVQARAMLPAEAAALMPQPSGESTVAIPPLPGSPALAPRAN